jgi:hypothetical protein
MSTIAIVDASDRLAFISIAKGKTGYGTLISNLYPK